MRVFQILQLRFYKRPPSNAGIFRLYNSDHFGPVPSSDFIQKCSDHFGPVSNPNFFQNQSAPITPDRYLAEISFKIGIFIRVSAHQPGPLFHYKNISFLHQIHKNYSSHYNPSSTSENEASPQLVNSTNRKTQHKVELSSNIKLEQLLRTDFELSKSSR